MQIILLCAGVSSRMQPISEKIFLEFCGKPLLEHQIENISSFSDFKDFVIVGNDKNIKRIIDICSKFKRLNFVFCIQENLKDGMKGAISACKDKIYTAALVVNSNDIVEKFLLKEVLKISKKSNYDSIICGKIVEKYFPGGYLSINKKGFLVDIVEKPGEGNEPSDIINIVVHYFKNFSEFIKIVEKENNSTDDAYEIGLKKYCKKKDVFVLRYRGFWQALKYPWHILDLQNYFLSKTKSFISPNSQIAKNVTIRGNVYIEKGVKVFEGATIVGPAYIGENCVVGNNSFIRESIIGKNCVIGFNTEITRSFLHKNIWTHSNYIGDSIIDQNVSFGSGTITGNLRLDENEIYVEIKGEKIASGKNKLGSIVGENTRFGINCSINPGIKVGGGAFIASGVNVQKNVENNVFIYSRQELIKKRNISVVSVEDRKMVVEKNFSRE